VPEAAVLAAIIPESRRDTRDHSYYWLGFQTADRRIIGLEITDVGALRAGRIAFHRCDSSAILPVWQVDNQKIVRAVGASPNQSDDELAGAGQDPSIDLKSQRKLQLQASSKYSAGVAA